VGNHIAVAILCWVNPVASAVNLGSYNYGGVSWTLQSQLSLMNGLGLAVVARQLTGTEISNLYIAGTGSITFPATVYGLRTAIWFVDGLKSASIHATQLARPNDLVNEVSVNMGYVPQGSYLMSAGFMYNHTEGAQFTADHPMVGRADNPNTESMTVVIADCRKFESGWKQTLRFGKSGTARRMAMAGLVFR
jgi:hypothetical protein